MVDKIFLEGFVSFGVLDSIFFIYCSFCIICIECLIYLVEIIGYRGIFLVLMSECFEMFVVEKSSY